MTVNSDIFTIARSRNDGHWSKSERGDLILSFTALSQILLGIVQGVFIVLGMNMELSTFYRVILSAISVAVSVPILIKRKSALILITYGITLLIYVIHIAVFPETIEYWHKEAFRFTIPISIPCALCVIAVKDRYIFYYVLRILAYLAGLLCMFTGLSILTGRYDIGFSYNQGLGYTVLFPILVLYYERKWYSLTFAAVLFLILLLYGSRGPVLSLALFIAYYLFTKRKYGLTIIIVFALFFGASILNSALQSQGLSSRTLELYLSGELDTENGRDALRQQINKGIEANPSGYGLFGDRVITHGANNAHSIVREMTAEFGVYFGPIVLLLFVFIILRCLYKLRGADRDMFAMFLFACVSPTLVSGSYLTNTNFAVFMGVLFMLYPKSKRFVKTIVRY